MYPCGEGVEELAPPILSRFKSCHENIDVENVK
jgi:hypothetical protein